MDEKPGTPGTLKQQKQVDKPMRLNGSVLHSHIKFVLARRSLTARVLFFVSIWTMIAFATVAFVISNLYRVSSEQALSNLLRAHLNTVIEAIDVSGDGILQGQPQLGSLEFVRPGSGWVWIVDPLDQFAARTPRIASSSVGSEELPVPPVNQIEFDSQYVRSYRLMDSSNNAILMSETEIELGETGEAVRIRVGGNRAIVEGEVRAFNRSLMIALLIAGFGTLFINMIAILIGLKPLDNARQSLERIRNGETDQLSGIFPTEIQPLVSEINALLDSNRRIIERARMQVGNLAHALKTPIAILINETRNLPKEQAQLIENQARAMQSQVQTYLDRAQISAQRGSILARTDIGPSLDRLVRVMGKLNPNLKYQINRDDQLSVAVETQDFEEIIGNLLENASRFARQIVTVSVQIDEIGQNIKISISDDGPGLSDVQKQKALKRGVRLDETKPGSGLGLSIVSEIVREYDGQFMLEDADKGGLSAVIRLPKVNA